MLTFHVNIQVGESLDHETWEMTKRQQVFVAWSFYVEIEYNYNVMQNQPLWVAVEPPSGPPALVPPVASSLGLVPHASSSSTDAAQATPAPYCPSGPLPGPPATLADAKFAEKQFSTPVFDYEQTDKFLRSSEQKNHANRTLAKPKAKAKPKRKAKAKAKA